MQYTLRELRARKNVTQAETSKEIGVSRATYIKWEADPTRIGIADIYKLAEYFDVAIDEIKIKEDSND